MLNQHLMNKIDSRHGFSETARAGAILKIITSRLPENAPKYIENSLLLKDI